MRNVTVRVEYRGIDRKASEFSEVTRIDVYEGFLEIEHRAADVTCSKTVYLNLKTVARYEVITKNEK